MSEGVKIIYTPFSKTRGIAWWHNYSAVNREIEQLHEESPVDVVEGSELSFAFLQKIPGIIYIIRLHGGHHFFAEGEKRKVNVWKGFQEKRSFQKADGFIGVSDYVVKHTSKFLEISPRPVRIIMYPINLEKFVPAQVDKIVPFRIVFAGTLIEKKGIRQLIEAMPQVLAAFPETELHIYGRDWKDIKGRSYLEFLQSAIPQQISKNILFHGPVDQKELPEIYAKANVCVFPSHIETLGLVAPEAMAMQRAVIYTLTGPGPEVLSHGESGWLCDPHDPASIAECILEAFSDWEEMTRRAINGRERVEIQFNIQHILGQNLEFYQEVKASVVRG
jgi:glycosyltransferase involved in cell wall biosynthesis